MACDALSGKHEMLCTALCRSEGTIVLPYKQRGHYQGSDVAPRSALLEGWGDKEQEWSGLGTTVRRAQQQSQLILDLHTSWEWRVGIIPNGCILIQHSTCRAGLFYKILKSHYMDSRFIKQPVGSQELKLPSSWTWVQAIIIFPNSSRDLTGCCKPATLSPTRHYKLHDTQRSVG